MQGNTVRGVVDTENKTVMVRADHPVMMVFTLATPAFALEASNDRFTTVSNAFGIPTDALYTLDSAL